MSQVTFNGVKISGVAAAVPEKTRTIEDEFQAFGESEVLKVSESTGVKVRHVSKTLCASDLCFESAKQLIQETGCDPESIEAVIFVSQSPDYRLPATACILQDRLGLPKTSVAYDINLGCSGFVYGLWSVSTMIASGAISKALLLAGDMSSVSCSPEDRSVAMLFGDAGTATLVEADPGAGLSSYVLGTDGSGKDHLIIEAGAYRVPVTTEKLTRVECEGGNKRSPADLYMNGAEIFTFTLKSVPSLVKNVLLQSGREIEEIDYFIFHQANRFMLEHLRKRTKIPAEKFVLGLENYGNTSSASIPLAMVTELREELMQERKELMLAGFGVGFSWAGVQLSTDKIVIPELILVPEPDVAEVN